MNTLQREYKFMLELAKDKGMTVQDIVNEVYPIQFELKREPTKYNTVINQRYRFKTRLSEVEDLVNTI